MLEKLEFNLHLIRHGESLGNAQPDIMGQTADVPLSARGEKQAALLADFWDKSGQIFDLIYSSPYDRALHTATIATKGIHSYNKNIILVPEIREYDAGDWLGASRSKTLTPEVKYRMNSLNQSFLPPKGESQNMVERRAANWLEQNVLYSEEVRAVYQNCQRPLEIAMFSHGMTIKCLLHYIMGFDRDFTWKITIDNTSICKLSFGIEGWGVRSVNDCSHLALR